MKRYYWDLHQNNEWEGGGEQIREVKMKDWS